MTNLDQFAYQGDGGRVATHLVQGKNPKRFGTTHKRYWKTESEWTAYWDSRREMITSPTLRTNWWPLLDTSNPLGFPVERSTTARDALQHKKTNAPTARVVLVHVGNFYEAYGYDALLLAQFGGVNLQKKNVPVVGQKEENIQLLLNKLVTNKIEAIIVEQYNAGGKIFRRMQQVITAFQPVYIFAQFEKQFWNRRTDDGSAVGTGNKNDDDSEQQQQQKQHRSEELPLLIIRTNENDFAIIFVWWLQQRAEVQHCTPSTMEDLLLKQSPSFGSPVFLCGNTGAKLRERLCALFGCEVRVVPDTASLNSDRDCVDAITRSYAKYLGHSSAPAAPFDLYVRDDANACAPLTRATAAQFGLVDGFGTGVESLVNHCIGRTQTRHLRSVFADWFVRFPPRTISKSITSTCAALKNNCAPFEATVPPKTLNRYTVLIKQQCAKVSELGHLRDAANQVVSLMHNTALQKVVTSLLPVVAYQMRLPDHHVSGESALESVERLAQMLSVITDTENSEACTDIEGVPSEYFERYERRSFRNHIKPAATDAFRNACDAVQRAAQHIRVVAQERFGPDVHLQYRRKRRKHNKDLCVVEAVVPDIHDKDVSRHSDGFYTSKAITNAAEVYETAVCAATEYVRGFLCDLCAEIDIHAVRFAWHFLVTLKALSEHTGECFFRKHWCAPTVALETDAVRIENGWPYWMNASEAVKNNARLERTMVLSGENQNGKTTFVRTVVANAILATTGLYCPAVSVSMPPLRHVFLRTVSGDWAREMMSAQSREAHDILPIVTANLTNSLIVLDEFAHGTSRGQAMGATVGFIRMCHDYEQARLIISTHLTEIKDSPHMPTEGVTWKRMQLLRNDVDRTIRYTYRLEDGVCEDSMAYAAFASVGSSDRFLRYYRESLPPHLASNVCTVAKRAILNYTEDEVVAVFHSVIPDMEHRQHCRVGAKEMPPLCYTNKHVVYLRLIESVMVWYVGEAKNIVKRIHQHRAKHPNCVFYIVAVESNAEELPLRVEQRTIETLGNNVVALDSRKDGFNRIYCE